MKLGENLAHLRRQSALSQEKLAERLGVSRQTISKWETGEVCPELPKLLELSELFSCSLDSLLKEDLTLRDAAFSDIRRVTVPAFRMARYVIISPNPEDDVNGYMDRWAERCGLLAQYPDAKRIGWDFPFLSAEQQNRFHLHGYVAAYILPVGFDHECPGVEYADQFEAQYAVITIREPFRAAFTLIPHAYQLLIKHLGGNGFKEAALENVLSCFEYVYQKDGIEYMDVFVAADSVNKADLFTDFRSI